MAKRVRVSAVVIRDETGQVLTVRKQGSPWLMLPGGKLDAEESDSAAAVREFAEELGVALTSASLQRLGVFAAPAANEAGHEVLATVFEHPWVAVDSPRNEITELAWVPPHLPDERLAPLLRDQVFPALRQERKPLRRVTVFTGSAAGNSDNFTTQVAGLARTLAAAGVGVVYGGGRVGLMGVLADTALAAGGDVFGVMPRALAEAEIAHAGLTDLNIVADMHARKLRMAELGDAFVALPGGTGTLEEIFEAWTWQQLGIHAKPVALYDIDGYWQPLLLALDAMTEHGFLAERYRSALIVCDQPDDLLAALAGWNPLPAKWTPVDAPLP